MPSSYWALAKASACLLVASVAASDNSDFVQASLERYEHRYLALQPANNSSNATPAPTPEPYTPLYRINFKKTWGDDHVCLTEIQFSDQMGKLLQAELIDATSCWGCAVSCGSCTVDYGNPLVLFDGETSVDSPQAYFCSDFGSFSGLGEGGNVYITFRLSSRPHSYSLRRADTKGNAIPKAFALEEIQMDDSWAVISNADEVAPSLDQKTSVEPIAGPAGRWWEYEDAECMSDMKLPAPAEGVLDVEYVPVLQGKGKIQNDGRAIFLDGVLGVLTIDGVMYYAKHMHLTFPSMRLIGDGNTDKTTVIGEVHITHQKSDGKATTHLHQEGLAIVVIQLVLPYEGAAPTKLEAWFEQMFGTLPIDGSSKPLPANFTLNVFSEQLNATYRELECQERLEDGSVSPDKPIWYLLDTPAVITGKVVQGFKDMFPFASSMAGQYSRTYMVDGVVQTIGYDGAGREHLMGVSQPKIDWEPIMPNASIPGMRFDINPDYLDGFGAFMPMGEWWFPPDDTALIQASVA